MPCVLREEADHDKTYSRDSCIAAIADNAIGSNFQHTIHDVLSGVLATVPAMRRHNDSLLQDIQFVHRAVSH
jgi:hypothetical protein